MIAFKHYSGEMLTNIKPMKEYDGLVDRDSIESVFAANYLDGHYWLKTKTGNLFSLTKRSYEELIDLIGR